jgi:Domain of unknown function (DUF4112)
VFTASVTVLLTRRTTLTTHPEKLLSRNNRRQCRPRVPAVAASALSCFLLYQAHRLGVPRHILLRMIANVAVEGIVGSVPLLGDAFDVTFRANRRNVRILREYFDGQM